MEDVTGNPWAAWLAVHKSDRAIDYMYRQFKKLPPFEVETENGKETDIHTCGQCLFCSGAVRGCKKYGGDIKAMVDTWDLEWSACGLFQAKPKKTKGK